MDVSTAELQRDLSQVHLGEPDSTFKALFKDRQSEILGSFSPEQQNIINYRQQLLTSLGSFIGKDFRIPIELNEPGGGWFWDFEANRIAIDPQDLLEKPMDELRFIISHEGSHRRISRAGDIPREVWEQPGFPFMMNAIEDPRVNNFLAETYPRSRDQMNLAYQNQLDFEGKAKQAGKDKLGFTPRFVQAGFEYIKQWFRETQGQEMALSEDLPEEVKTVVMSTVEAARDSWWRYPSRVEADQGENLIRRYASASYEINRDQVWPEFKKLVEEDLQDERVQEMIKQMQEQMEGQPGQDGQGMPQDLKNNLDQSEQQELEQKISEAMEKSGQNGGKSTPVDFDSLSDGLKQKLKDYIDSLPDEVKKELAEKARQALEEYEEQLNHELEGKLADNPAKRAQREGQDPIAPAQPKPEETEDVGTTEAETQFQRDQYRDLVEQALHKDENVYEKARRQELVTIDELEADLRDIFVQRRMNRWRGGYKSGKKINIMKRIQEKAKEVPVVQSQAWERREHPSEKNYAISLLVDLSGSMKGQKIAETFKAAVVLAEVLNRLSIKTEILGFNDKLHVYQSFGQDMSPEIRERVGGMLQEVSTPAAQWNDDGWSLDQASQRLARQPEDQKFLIVLSDGVPEPSPAHSGRPYELKTVINRISGETDQKLVGLGIGRGTGHVSEYYPNSIADIGVRDMSKNLSGLLREVVENYDSF